jgi:small subunit ribosomal protein S6
MNQYEVMYVIDTALEDQVRQELIARFASLVEQNGGKVDRIDEWGKRRLAYAINYKTEGYYVLMYISAPPALPRELQRNLQISESILRYLVIRFEGALPPKREPLRPFQPQYTASAPAPEAPVTKASESPAMPGAPAPEAPAMAEAAAEQPAEQAVEEAPAET